MKIIIVGCGKVGEELAAELSQENNDVMVIDRNEDVVNTLCGKYDIMGTVGNGAAHSVQVEADIENADLLIAVTGSDELNLLCCLTARMAGRDCHTIARLRNPEYSSELSFLKEELGLAMVINQEHIAAREIARVLTIPSAIEIDTFAKGRVEILRFRNPEGSVLNGVRLSELQSKLHCSVLVCTVERDGQVTIPKGDFELRSGDIISILADATAEEAFFQKVGIQTNRIRKVMIVGGGDTSYYLAEALLKNGVAVKIIERNLERCEALSEKLPKASIIHGDGTDKLLLEEEGLENMEGFVALTDMDEQNIMLSLFARSSHVRKIITKINKITFDDVVESLNLDTVIHPRSLAAEYATQYVRARKNSMGSNVETVHRIIENKAEALEFHIREGFSRAGQPLSELKLKKDVMIGCINRQGRIILPRGKDAIEVGDTVIVVTTTRGMNDIADIFEK